MPDTTSAPPHKPPAQVRATWQGEHRFDIVRAKGGVSQRIDGDSTTGPGPFDMFLGSIATCAMVDVVDIMAKRRTPVERLSVDIVGTRAQTVPHRLVHLSLTVNIEGAGIDRANAERAVDLAITKYCSVRSSIDPAIPVETKVLIVNR